MNWVRHSNSATFETKSSYRRVARQSLPCYTVVARLGFKRGATAVLTKSNLIRSIYFGTAVARRLNRAYFQNCTLQWRIQGRDPGGGGAVPPLFLDQAEARRAEKIFFGEWALRYLRVGWRPRPPLLISRSGSSTALFILFLRNVGKRQTSVLTELLQIRWEVVVSMERSCTILATQLCMLILIK